MDEEQKGKRRRWKFSQEHYGEMAKWTERVALLLFGSVVIQNVFEGFRLAEPVVWGGVTFTGATYFLALFFLHKS